MHELHMAFPSLSREIKTGFLPLTDGVLRFPRRGASLQIGATAGGGGGGGEGFSGESSRRGWEGFNVSRRRCRTGSLSQFSAMSTQRASFSCPISVNTHLVCFFVLFFSLFLYIHTKNNNYNGNIFIGFFSKLPPFLYKSHKPWSLR